MPKSIFALIGLTFSLLACNLALGEIYKTVDKEGRVTYSDVPPPNAAAKPIELKSLNTTPPPVMMPSPIPTTVNTNPQASGPYQLKLTAPENGTTLLPNERSVTISVSLNSVLQGSDVLAYKLDGNILAKTTESSFTLNEPPRGEHSISVDVINSEGKSIAQSDATTVIVMRPLVKQTPPPVPKK
ncbi:MAG: DUF4124 domain-containing protein [Moraxellaceae bacterium]|nr:MAG: DUF4124 domain-containing protein [Moraxellaceae bacterium]